MSERESSQVSIASGGSPPTTRRDSTPQAGATPARPAPQIPDHELLRCIGRGSYGEVWLARGTLGFYRALKVVYRATFDSDRPYEREFDGIRKFEPVSRTHPSQVDILHVGRNDAEGYFYYVMELADDQQTGAVIDPANYEPKTLRSELKQRGRLPFQGCLDIALALTTALDHLHRNGLVHRDVKPSNIIFVNGLPKLADIGLVATVDATCSFVGTEGYLPPEGPGTPPADLYSLGKVLYEISTGKDRRDFPELPVSADGSDDETGTRELNEIILRACENDQRKRYASAAQMHQELRLLHAGRSVRHLRKVERRLAVMTRIGTATAAALVLAAIAYFGAIQQARRATRLAKLEAEQHQRADQVAQFFKDMLKAIGPSVALGRDTTLLREILERTAERVGKELEGQAEVEAELRTILGETYHALGRYQESEDMHLRALALRERLFGIEHPLVASSKNGIALALRDQGRLDQAEELYRASLAMQQRLLSEEHLEIAASLNDLATVLLYRGDKLAEAEELELRALEMTRKLTSGDDARVAMVFNNLASIRYSAGKLQAAAEDQMEALRIQRTLLDKDHPDIAQSLNNLSVMLVGVGRLAEAEGAAREALELRKKLLGPKHSFVATSLNNLASALWHRSKLEESEFWQREALALQTETLGDKHRETLISLNNLGTVLHEQGRFTEAEQVHRQALETRRQVFGTNSVAVAESLHNLARVLCDRGSFAEAAAMHSQGIEIQTKMLGTNHPQVARSFQSLGLACFGLGRMAEAEAHQVQSLTIRRALFKREHPHLAQSLDGLGWLSLATDRLSEAETNLLDALAIRREFFREDHPHIATTLENLALVYRRQARLEEAEQRARECLLIRERQLTNDWRMFCARTLLGSALSALGKHSEAESPLVSGCAGMSERLTRIPALSKSRYSEALTSLVQLYEKTGRPTQASEWKQKLAEFQAAEAQAKLPASTR